MKVSCRNKNQFPRKNEHFLNRKMNKKFTIFCPKMMKKVIRKFPTQKPQFSHRASETTRPPFAILLSMHLISSAIPRAREGVPGGPRRQSRFADRWFNGR